MSNKLRIIKYFDDLRAKVDLLVELYNIDNRHNQQRVDEMNTAREQWLKEIDECLAFNIAEYNKLAEIDQSVMLCKMFTSSVPSII